MIELFALTIVVVVLGILAVALFVGVITYVLTDQEEEDE